MSISGVTSAPEIGSLLPLSLKYFSISRRSNTHPEDGEITGLSGTSCDTKLTKMA